MAFKIYGEIGTADTADKAFAKCLDFVTFGPNGTAEEMTFTFDDGNAAVEVIIRASEARRHGDDITPPTPIPGAKTSRESRR